MKVFEKLNQLKKNIERLQKLNEDLIENHLANKNKINKLEMKLQILEKGIRESVDEIEEFKKDLNANS